MRNIILSFSIFLFHSINLPAATNDITIITQDIMDNHDGTVTPGFITIQFNDESFLPAIVDLEYGPCSQPDQTIFPGETYTLGPSSVVSCAGEYCFTIYSGTFTDNLDDDCIVEVCAIVNVCSWAGADRSICLDGSTQLGCNNEIPDDLCFNWTPTEGLDDPTGVRPFASPNATTSYYLAVTNQDGDLVGEDEVTVNVDNSVGNLILDSQYNEICSGTSCNLTIDHINDVQELSFLWSTGSLDSEITAFEPGQYSVTITNINSGCTITLDKTIQEASLDVVIEASTQTI